MLFFAPGYEIKILEGVISGALGRLYTLLGNQDKASEYFDQAFSKLSKEIDKPRLHFLRIKGDYANHLSTLGKNDAAEDLYREIIPFIEKLGVLDHPLVIASLPGFLKVLFENGKANEALGFSDKIIVFEDI